jgi:isoquinoline 1-oxidoreductase beta subunit
MDLNALTDRLPRVSRRGLLIGGGVGAGLLVAWSFWPRSYAPNLVAARGEHVLNAYLKVGEDGHVTVVVPDIEMGQGSYTVLPQIVADELGADWRTVAVEPAPLNPVYANMALLREWSEGTATQLFGDAARWAAEREAVSDSFQVTDEAAHFALRSPELRRAAAAARTMLAMAAGKRWGADWRACDTDAGFVVLGEEKLRFGELAAQAAGFDPPDGIPLRTNTENRLIGQSVPRLDVPSKIDGTAGYAADVRLPGMLYAAIRMGPLGDTRFLSADKAKLAGRRDVVQLVTHQRWVAVVARTWWAANEALDAIAPKFSTTGPFPDSKSAAVALQNALEGEGVVMTEGGDVDAAFAGAKLLEADYRVDFAPHAAIEPMTATAIDRDGRIEIWASCQAPSLVRRAVARAIGEAERDVVVHPVMIGGSFGRKYETEAAVQAAQIARAVGAPVQLVWSRSEDLLQDRFRPAAAARMVARMGPAGQVEAWRAKIAAPAALAEMQARIIGRKRPAEAVNAIAGSSDPSVTSGAATPYSIANLSIRHCPADVSVPTGKWRSGADSYTAFFTESFIDELAKESGVEASSFRMAMLGRSPRLALCLSRVASLGSWEGGGPGTQQGIACHAMKDAFIAVMAEAYVSDTQRVVVEKLVAVADVGRVIHRDIARQQIEGALLFGMAAATGNRIAIEAGMTGPRRIGELSLPILATCPQVIVEIMPSREASGPVGEIGVPAVAPAIANALFAGSGRRFRSLPLNPANA